MGGKSGGNTTSTVTEQRIPKEFLPYFERMMTRAEEESVQPYTSYGASRLSTATPDTLASYNMVRDIATRESPGANLATDVAARNVSGAGELLAADAPYQFSEFEYAPTEILAGDQVQTYMDPYVRSVLEVQKEKAREDYDIARAGRNAAAVQAGAFGGSRQQVGESMAERDLLSRMRDIEATGMQGAYADAVRRFEADRAAKLEADRARAAEAERVQSASAREAQDFINRQTGLMEFGADQAGMVAKLEEAARSGDIQAAQLLETIGKAQQAEEQAGLDLAYQDFLRQQGYSRDQISFLSSLLQGLPIGNAGTTENITPYNPVQQLLGAGLSALSLYKGFTG